MEIKVFKALWGMEEGPTMEDKFRLIREAGYDGLECPKPAEEPAAWVERCARHGLEYIGMVFADEAAALGEQVRALLPYRPVRVNAHTGRDKMAFDDGCALLREALRIEADAGLPIAHETHRRRMFFAPWATAAYLREFPTLRLCADFSHWCVVCESMMEDMEDLLEPACSQAIHIHGRVGYEEGPQVPDPRAPEYLRHLERHETWWDAIRRARAEGDGPALTFTPEFGPPHYMHTLPYTGQPVANLWDICRWVADRERARWGG